MNERPEQERQTGQSTTRLVLMRVIALLSLSAGTAYVGWRWLFSVNWTYWWIALPLVVAETYALVDGYLFAVTIWRMKRRGAAPPPPPGATVDVLITTYNESVDMVMATARAAKAIAHPHETWVLDDGDRPDMRAAAEALGVGYITRSADWRDRPRHAKAGNLNNALFQTTGEFLLILDADQIPEPEILDHTLGWFTDPEVALVQTPQWFSNVTESDPLGSQAPLFYGPVQQGKDGWNAAFFCGSNAIIRREALMQLGITGYVREVEEAVRDSLRASGRILDRAARSVRKTRPETAAALAAARAGVRTARRELDAGEPVADVTYRFQQQLAAASRAAVDEDLAGIKADLAAIAELPIEADEELGLEVVDEEALDRLADRDWTPLGAIRSVSELMRGVDVGLEGEAQPVMPMATISVTEDMATCMRLHTQGWRTVYHHEVLAHGLAPEDLGTMLQQRLRWAQGTLQVLLKENPLTVPGLKFGQRLMYFATMWSYLSGFAALAFLLAPVFYLTMGVLPVHAYGLTFLMFFTPYFLLNQALFFVVGYGVKTWRGHQYSLALFPIWIRATVTAVANVWFGRKLGFVVTPKERTEGGTRFPARLIWPQLTIMVLLVAAVVVGVVQLVRGEDVTFIGVAVNTVWVAYDLVVLSVIIQAALYRAPEPEDEVVTA
ncbi:MAG TPA: glycosyltransferase family 2 protein [Nocardioides sp.]|nr:glycosyltransferase family 2 protein [Nocardioides sp.]